MDSSSVSSPLSSSLTSVSSRSIAASKLGGAKAGPAGSPSRDPSSAGRFFSAAISTSGPHRLDPGVGFAARELEGQPFADRESRRVPHQSTVAAPRQAIGALEHEPRRERPQPVAGAREPRAPRLEGREPGGREPSRDPNELLPPPSDLARPLAQPVATRQSEQPLAGPLEPRAQRHPEAGGQIVHALLVEAEGVPLPPEAITAGQGFEAPV